MADGATARWEGRPGASRALRIVAVVGPLLAGLAVALALSLVLPAPQDVLGGVLRWVVLSLVATVVVIAVDRYARRLLPIAALLRLNLAFPDGAPSRYRVAREAASTRGLAEEVRRAREHGLSDDRTEAAASVLRLVSALSLHDKATRGHAERTRVLTDMIAAELELPAEDVDRLRWASLIHDVGKIAVHPRILNKATAPTAEEWAVLRQHPEEGARLTAPLRAWLGAWALTIEQHHERWDGEGYPHGLAGREIHLGARIVAVADAFDVMTAARAYREAIPAHAAREELAAGAGRQFDPLVVRAFLGIPAGSLRAVVGPLSWLATLPMVRPFTRVPSSAGASVAVSVATAGVLAAGGLAVPPVVLDPPAPAVAAPAAVERPTPEVLPETRVLGTQEVREPELPADPTVAPEVVEPPAPVPPPPPAPPSVPAPVVVTPPPPPRPPVTVTENPRPEPTPTPVAPASAPVAADDVLEVDEDTTGTVALFANDTDPQDDALALLSLDRTGPALGVLRATRDGVVTFTPFRNVVGTETLVYRVSDGRSTDTATLRITVRPVNDPPVAVADRYGVEAPATLTVAADQGLLANDVDVDGDTLRVATTPATAPPASEGRVSLRADGSFTFVAADGFSGTTGFTYRVTDGLQAVTGTVRIEVTRSEQRIDGGLFLTGSTLSTTTSRLSPSRPAAAGDRIPDWDQDGAPGRTIEDSDQEEDEDDPRRFHDWRFTLADAVQLDGWIDLTLTSAVAGLEGGEAVDYTVFLYSCDGEGRGCTRLASKHNKHVNDWNAEGSWSTRTIRVGTSDRLLPVGSTLRLKLLFHHEDVWLPLTGDHPSVLRVTQAP